MCRGLYLKRPDVDPAIDHAIKSRAALIEKRRRSEIRIARINRRTVWQQGMSQCRAAIILQWLEQRIGVDLVTGASQEAATIVTAEIIAKRRNCAGAGNVAHV